MIRGIFGPSAGAERFRISINFTLKRWTLPSSASSTLHGLRGKTRFPGFIHLPPGPRSSAQLQLGCRGSHSNAGASHRLHLAAGLNFLSLTLDLLRPRSLDPVDPCVNPLNTLLTRSRRALCALCLQSSTRGGARRRPPASTAAARAAAAAHGDPKLASLLQSWTTQKK